MTRSVKRLCAVVTACAALAFAAPAPALAAGDPGPASQRLDWTTCAGALNPDLRCAQVRVPLDYAHPNGRQISVMISRLRATDPARRHGVLLTTYGGPGLTGGLFLPEDYAATMSPEVLARYDLVGFDVRFLEQSTPISCGQPQEEPEGFWNRAAPTREIFDAQVAEARRYAADCWREAGWALPHANLANVARDMDVIRAALGERRISFRGADAAGTIGAIYATLFPRRVDRFVLDSPFPTDTLWRDNKMIRTRVFEEGLHRFAGWIAQRDDRFGFGTTVAQVEENVTGMWRRAPIYAGGRDWTADELVYYTLLGVFFERFFEIMALNLSAINNGDAAPVPIPLYPSARPGVTGVPADNHTAVSTAYQCGDNAWPRHVATYWSDVRLYSTLYPHFGLSHANIFPCAFWRSTQDNRVELGGGRTPPVMITAATLNPISPVEEVRRVAMAIPGSRVVLDDAQSHELFPFFGSDCLKAAATDYLVTGRLPADHVFCPRPDPAT